MIRAWKALAVPEPMRCSRSVAPCEAASTRADTRLPKLLEADLGLDSEPRSPKEGAEVSAMDDDLNRSAASCASSFCMMLGRAWDW